MSNADLIDQLRETAKTLAGDPGFSALSDAAELCRRVAEVLDVQDLRKSQDLLDTIRDLRQQVAYHQVQDGLLSRAQEEAQRLRDELAEVKRPLDAQMARLNQNLIEANERIVGLNREVTLLRDVYDEVMGMRRHSMQWCEGLGVEAAIEKVEAFDGGAG